MAKDQAIFSTMHERNTKQIFVGDDRSLCVVGSREIQIDDDRCKDVLFVPCLSCNLLSLSDQ